MDFLGYLIITLVIFGGLCLLVGLFPLVLKYYDGRTMKRLAARLDAVNVPRSSTGLNRR